MCFSFVFQSNLTTSGCGTERLCAAEPSGCDPASGSCFHTSVKRIGGFNHNFGLAGESDGYLACALGPPNGGTQTVYVCVNRNGIVTFRSVSLANGVFTNIQTPVTNVKAKVTGRRIQCEFSATIPNATSTNRAADSTYTLSVLTGSVAGWVWGGINGGWLGLICEGVRVVGYWVFVRLWGGVGGVVMGGGGGGGVVGWWLGVVGG
uniref:Uncharacterized protein n=1 Tax=Knipowitschia caucasica TaxID=637954 RepID=A0AAV2KQU8_KNICA